MGIRQSRPPTTNATASSAPTTDAAASSATTDEAASNVQTVFGGGYNLVSPWQDPRVMPTVIQNVLAGQRRRAVAPKEGLAPLQFRLRGRLYHSWTDDTFELLVLNTDGNTQPAASFREYMLHIFGELLALRDAMFLAFPREWDEDSDSFKAYDSYGYLYEGISARFDWEEILAALEIPWPLKMILRDMDIALLDDLGAKRRLFEAKKLKLVVSKIPRLGGVEYLFKEFYTAAPAPATPDELQYVMDHMANSWMELACGCGNAMDTFRTTTIRCPEDDGFEAEGVVATYFDGADWAVGKAEDFPASWEGPESDGDY